MRDIKIRYVVEVNDGTISTVEPLDIETIESDRIHPYFAARWKRIVDRNLWTGLKDKNGNEIYESDLIVHSGRNGGKAHPVVFNGDLAAWCGDYGLKYPLQTCELDELEVVGNIYETT